MSILHTYLFYPVLLRLLSKGIKPNIDVFKVEELPSITIIIAAYNEELVIGSKLQSIVDSDYNHELLEVLVGSDGSSDATNKIVAEFSKNHPFIKLHVLNRHGKTGVLNSLTPMANSDIIVYTDANVLFSKDCLSSMISKFKDESIGLVGANITTKQVLNEGISFQEGKYIEQENLLKYREGLLWGSMMGAFGGSYAMRKKLFKSIPSNFIVDDFYLTMNVLISGKKAILDLRAICYEEVSVKEAEEFRRKVRMSSGNFQNLGTYKSVLWKCKPSIGFSFLSHKILRWITPLFLILTLVTSFYLRDIHWIYQVCFVIQLVLLGIPALNAALKGIGFHSKLIQFVAYFYSMNLALLIGMMKYLRGIKSAIWEPTKR